MISRLRLGHCLVNTRLHQFGRRQSGNCANCPELEDLNQFIHCPFNNLLNNIGGNLHEILADYSLSTQLAKNILLLNRIILT